MDSTLGDGGSAIKKTNILFIPLEIVFKSFIPNILKPYVVQKTGEH